jgi:hypothetical protein
VGNGHEFDTWATETKKENSVELVDKSKFCVTFKSVSIFVQKRVFLEIGAFI